MDDALTHAAIRDEIDPEAVSCLVQAATDIAVRVDRQGIVRDVRFGGEIDLAPHMEPWNGRPWAEVVTPECRVKAEALLQRTADGGFGRAREVNHPDRLSGEDIPIRYRAVGSDSAGSVFLVGRDLRAIAALELKLFASGVALDAEYARLRAVDLRYRKLFDLTADPVLIVDGATRAVVEANAAAVAALDPGNELTGGALLACFDPASGVMLETALSRAAATGEASIALLRSARTGRGFVASLSSFHQGERAFILIRLQAALDRERHPASAAALDVASLLPDGLILTDDNGIIQEVNVAFLRLAQLATPAQALGYPIDRWLGRGRDDFGALRSLLTRDGSVRGFASSVKGSSGALSVVSVSAVCVGAEVKTFGFVLTTSESAQDMTLRSVMPRSVDDLTQLVGHRPMKELVREATDVIEQLCVEAALSLTAGNRAAAAGILGMSRQSLYTKLARFGLQARSDDGDA